MTAGAARRVLRAGGATLPCCLAAVALAGMPACKKTSPPPSLAEPISVEQPGGSATQLIERGSEIPTSATESFTTLHEGDRSIAVHVVRGPGRSAQKLRDEGWWVVDGVSAAPAGHPRVLVTFEVDPQGTVSVTAREGDRKLRVEKVEEPDRSKLAPAPLTEPDEEEGAEEEED
ncbi:MAG: Hsp70 family protein [Myxococcales bacterium]